MHLVKLIARLSARNASPVALRTSPTALDMQALHHVSGGSPRGTWAQVEPLSSASPRGTWARIDPLSNASPRGTWAQVEPLSSASPRGTW